MKSGENTFYKKLMAFGRNAGCHQLPERSFFIRGKQCPVCARCTGVMIGNILAYGMFFIYRLPSEFYVMGCAVMFADWFIQYIGICSSTNLRRLITGVVGGCSLTTLYCMVIQYIVKILMKI